VKESFPFLLFIAHEIPTLADNIKASKYYNLSDKEKSRMPIMLETKDDDNNTYFIIGEILYCGAIETVEACQLTNPRGSQFIVCHPFQAAKADIKAFPSRASTHSEILEIDMNQYRIDITNQEKFQAFLKPCTHRVDVILDPIRNDSWYPYWESKRKMAPQFRSRGVGYIRLGVFRCYDFILMF
jgi:hypothetical protein